MQCVNHVLGVMFDYIRVGQNRDPVILTTLRRLDPIHAETTGKTRYTTEHGLERLGQMV